MKPRTRRALLALGSLAVTLLAADVALRSGARDGRLLGLWVPPFGLQSTPERQAALRRQLEVLRAGAGFSASLGFHPHFGWINRPGTYREQGVPQHFNSIGARGASEPAPEPPALRVACFGESYTFGSEVLDGEDWPAQLAAVHGHAETINLGVGGWGTDQALLRWRAMGADLGARVVFAGLLLENIRRNVNRYRPFAYPWHETPSAKPRFSLAGGELVLVPLPYGSRVELTEAARDGRLRRELASGDWWAGYDPRPAWSGIAALLSGVRHQRRRDPAWLWTHPDEEPYRVTLALLQAFHDEVRDAGVERFCVLVFPDERDLRRRIAGRPYWDGLLADLEARGIPCVDLSAALAREPDPGALYLDSHLSPRGNRVVAERLAEWLAGGAEAR